MSTTAISLAADYRKLQEMADSGDEFTPKWSLIPYPALRACWKINSMH